MGIRRKRFTADGMECLPQTLSYHKFIDNYFTSFCLFTDLGVDSIQETGVLGKSRLRR